MSAASSSSRALVDTSAYYALIDRGERTHQDAVVIQQRLMQERWRLWTTNFILAEIPALTLSRLGYHTALTALQRIDASNTIIIRVTADHERSARALIVRYHDKAFSLTDALSFVVMERLDISHAFSFDHNFTQYGLQLLIGR